MRQVEESVLLRLGHIVLTVLGLVLMLSLPLLWTAWTPAVLLTVAGTVLAAALAYCLLYSGIEVLFGGQWRAGEAPRVRLLTEDVLAELGRLGPWIHHNRTPGDPRFQRKMEQLAQRLRPPTPPR